MTHSITGSIHLTAAILAMISGSIVLLTTKGTLRHRQIGYVYVASMVIMNATAFLIYSLFGKFGPFHGAAIFSSVSIIGGMVPLLLRVKNWLYYHYYFMNWSIIGLFAAFWAETFTRLSAGRQFWPLVFVAMGVTVFIGSFLVRRYKARFLPEEKLEK